MYWTSAVLSVRKFATACDSLAAYLDRSKLGIAIVAINKIIATTMSSSSNENPFSFFISSPVRPWPPIQRQLPDVDYLLLSFSRTGNPVGQPDHCKHAANSQDS